MYEKWDYQNIVSSKDTWREHQMYLKSENNTSMVASETNKLIKLLYNSLLTNYQGNKSEKSERWWSCIWLFRLNIHWCNVPSCQK